MAGPKPPAVALTAAERRELDALAGAHRTPQQVALRARIEAAPARLWRGRWLGLGAVPPEELGVAERLEDAPRPGGPCRISAEQVCRITALACEAPAASGRPISQWSGRELADEAVKRGLVERLSARHAGRLLKRGICSPIASAPG